MGRSMAWQASFAVALLISALAASSVNAQSNQTSLPSNVTTLVSENQTAFAALVSSLGRAIQARLTSVNLSSLNTTQGVINTNQTQTLVNLTQAITAAVSVNLTALTPNYSNTTNGTLTSSPDLRAALSYTLPSNYPFNTTDLYNQTLIFSLSFPSIQNSTANLTNASSPLYQTLPVNQTIPLNGSLTLSCLFTLNGTGSNITTITPTSTGNITTSNGTLTLTSNLSTNGTLLLRGTLAFGNLPNTSTVVSGGVVGALSPASGPLPQTQPLAPVGAPPGQFSNPVLFAEFADPDVIRVQNDFYMAVTSFHMFPGAQIMHSRDLINWEYLSHAIPQLPPSIDATCYNLDGCEKYGVGTWANSLRFHNNTFYLMTNMNDNGVILSRASNPAGPWTVSKLGWYCQDPGLFFDDDGSIYTVCGHGSLDVYTLSADFQPLADVQIANDSVQYPGFASRFYGIEGSHMYKTNGTYYIYALWGGGQGQQLALRASKPTGPYTYYKVLQGLGEDSLGYKQNSIHQGCLVNTSNGEWWSYLLQDHDAVGRVPIIQTVKFVNGWPTIGDGHAQQTVPYPSGIYTPSIFIATSDEFNSTTLGKQWQWNHLPDNTKWSLAERPGYLTLHPATVTPNGNLTQVRNQLTERVWGPQSTATVALDVSALVDGDVAGLSIFQVQYAYIGVRKTGTSLSITHVINGNSTASVPFTAASGVVYFQATFLEGSQSASFAYSTDGQTFDSLGSTQLRPMRFRNT